jgi:hypothetical protein
VSYEVFHLDSRERAREKEVSRQQDILSLESGSLSEADIAASNDFFSALDIGNFRIRCVGRKAVSQRA